MSSPCWKLISQSFDRSLFMDTQVGTGDGGLSWCNRLLYRTLWIHKVYIKCMFQMCVPMLCSLPREGMLYLNYMSLWIKASPKWVTVMCVWNCYKTCYFNKTSIITGKTKASISTNHAIIWKQFEFWVCSWKWKERMAVSVKEFPFLKEGFRFDSIELVCCVSLAMTSQGD